jgi:four helix bundle protein
MSDYRQLDAWKLGHATRVAIYRATSGFPRVERYALADQLRRAASSITANIAEGAGRTNRDFARLLRYSIGSINEVEDQLLLARDIGYLPHDTWKALTDDLSRVRSMVTRLRQHLLASPDLDPPRRQVDPRTATGTPSRRTGNGKPATGNGAKR